MSEPVNDKLPKSTTKGTKRERAYVEVTQLAHHQLRQQGKHLKVSNVDYVSAAISYFAERGLDPTTDVQREGVLIQRRLNERCDGLEQQVKSLGDRLFGFLTLHERNLYGFLQGQQRALFGFMQNQEASHFNYLLAFEQQVIAPVVKLLMQAADDAFVSRRLGEQVVLRQQDIFNEYPVRHQRNNTERDVRVIEMIKKFVADNPMPGPQPTRAPSITGAPMKGQMPTAVPPAPATTSATDASLSKATPEAGSNNAHQSS